MYGDLLKEIKNVTIECDPRLLNLFKDINDETKSFHNWIKILKVKIAFLLDTER